MPSGEWFIDGASREMWDDESPCEGGSTPKFLSHHQAMGWVSRHQVSLAGGRDESGGGPERGSETAPRHHASSTTK